MKRYNMDWHYEREFEDPAGEWFKAEDVEKEIEEAYKSGYFTGQYSEKIKFKANSTPGHSWDPPPPPPLITLTTLPECNCETQSQLRKTRGPVEFELFDPDWICPAHGYKAVKQRVRSI